MAVDLFAPRYNRAVAKGLEPPPHFTREPYYGGIKDVGARGVQFDLAYCVTVIRNGILPSFLFFFFPP